MTEKKTTLKRLTDEQRDEVLTERARRLVNGKLPSGELHALAAWASKRFKRPVTVKTIQSWMHAQNKAAGTAAPVSKLTEDEVRAIRRRAAAGETQETLGREYGVSRSAVAQIVTRRTWAHVEEESEE